MVENYRKCIGCFTPVLVGTSFYCLACRTEMAIKNQSTQFQNKTSDLDDPSKPVFDFVRQHSFSSNTTNSNYVNEEVTFSDETLRIFYANVEKQKRRDFIETFICLPIVFIFLIGLYIVIPSYVIYIILFS